MLITIVSFFLCLISHVVLLNIMLIPAEYRTHVTTFLAPRCFFWDFGETQGVMGKLKNASHFSLSLSLVPYNLCEAFL